LGAGTASAQGSGQIGTADTPVGTIYTESIRNSNTIRLGAGLQSGSQFSLLPGKIVAGHNANTIAEETEGGTISGGGAGDGGENSIGDNCNFGTISGGTGNEITDDNSDATISGGSSNEVTGPRGTVSGGGNNKAVGRNAAIGGGSGNTVEGEWATVPGGRNNTAAENYSFAVGQNANATEPGAFVVGDSSEDPVTAANPNEARFQMNVVANAFELVDQQDEPILEEGEGMLYISDSGDDHEEGDLVYAYNNNDNGETTTKTVVIANNPDTGDV